MPKIKRHITPGGRVLRRAFSPQFMPGIGRWVVGIGSFWPGRKMTIFEARALVKKRNAKL